MFTIGQEELDKAPDLGETVRCHKCGKTHIVQYGETVHADGTKTPSKTLAFFKCPASKASYLCGINGKLLNLRTDEMRKV